MVVVVVVVGVTVVAIIVVSGPDGASSLYARPLLLACMHLHLICMSGGHPPAHKKTISRTKTPWCWRDRGGGGWGGWWGCWWW